MRRYSVFTRNCTDSPPNRWRESPQWSRKPHDPAGDAAIRESGVGASSRTAGTIAHAANRRHDPPHAVRRKRVRSSAHRTGQSDILKIAKSRGIDVTREAQLKPGVADQKVIKKIVDDFSPDELQDCATSIWSSRA
jgi:hypothetical protein